MRIVVVGAGSWGTAFARLAADRGHDTTLACRDPEQARAIAETGRNPKYLKSTSLHGIDAAPNANAGPTPTAASQGSDDALVIRTSVASGVRMTALSCAEAGATSKPCEAGGSVASWLLTTIGRKGNPKASAAW